MDGTVGLSMPDRRKEPLHTPDGRYMVVRGRAELVSELMAARAALPRAADADLRGQVRARIDAAKKALGERGAVWWTDGAPDYNRHLVKNTPYAAWYASVSSGG